MSLTLICPICGESWTEPSLEVFLQRVHQAWNKWRPLPEGIEKRLKESNNPERLRKILKETGYLTVFCQNCAMAATIASARNILEVG